MRNGKSPGKSAKDVAATVRQLRREAGYSTQREFCRANQISPSVLSRVENGKRVSPANVAKIARALGIGPAELAVEMDPSARLFKRLMARQAAERAQIVDYLNRRLKRLELGR